MKKYSFYIVFLLFFSVKIFAQQFSDSNLPIIIINTDNGVTIIDDPRVRATMKIIFRGGGERNYITDQNYPQYLNYDGRIDIEIRGSSSQSSDKKCYGFTTRMADNITNNNVSLLGMPEENDWVLNGMVFDPAMIREYLCFNLSREIGEYASRTEYCELVINNEFKGLYLLQEKIKADDNRVDITRIGKNDNKFPDLSGGYITKADKTTGGDPVAWTMKNNSGEGVAFIHDLPKPEDVTAYQDDYIQRQFRELEISAIADDESVTGGFPSVIDVPSFIDYIIISELSSNADSYQFSTYFHKDRNGKLRAGPVWDNDLTFGNDLFFWGLDRSKTNVWQMANGDNEGARFWRDLVNNNTFRCYLAKRWNELIRPGQPLNRGSVNAFIDQTVSYINEAVVRENLLWGNIGNHAQRIEAMKIWIENRIPWITSNLGSSDMCSNIALPPLVISKIMYHPAVSVEYPDEDKLEYLEITNNGDQRVSLEGIYFAGTGFVYQFPAGSSAAPFSSLILAGNYQTFRSKYGFMPFGQFTRNLSNKSESLVLSDAFGNIIDNVCYGDTLPWPEADGNGYYLSLIDPGLDNGLPSSWIASNDIVTSSEYPSGIEDILIYPNPAESYICLTAGFEIRTVSLYDVYGRLIKTEKVNSESGLIDVSSLGRGLYIMKIETPSGTLTRKIIRK